MDGTDCSHPLIFASMCAICGQTVNSSKMYTVCHFSDNLQTSEELSRQLGVSGKERLDAEKRLILLVDLDQTVLHTSTLPLIQHFVDSGLVVEVSLDDPKVTSEYLEGQLKLLHKFERKVERLLKPLLEGKKQFQISYFPSSEFFSKKHFRNRRNTTSNKHNESKIEAKGENADQIKNNNKPQDVYKDNKDNSSSMNINPDSNIDDFNLEGAIDPEYITLKDHLQDRVIEDGEKTYELKIENTNDFMLDSNNIKSNILVLPNKISTSTIGHINFNLKPSKKNSKIKQSHTLHSDYTENPESIEKNIETHLETKIDGACKDSLNNLLVTEKRHKKFRTNKLLKVDPENQKNRSFEDEYDSSLDIESPRASMSESSNEYAGALDNKPACLEQKLRYSLPFSQSKTKSIFNSNKISVIDISNNNGTYQNSDKLKESMDQYSIDDGIEKISSLNTDKPQYLTNRDSQATHEPKILNSSNFDETKTIKFNHMNSIFAAQNFNENAPQEKSKITTQNKDKKDNSQIPACRKRNRIKECRFKKKLIKNKIKVKLVQKSTSTESGVKYWVVHNQKPILYTFHIFGLKYFVILRPFTSKILNLTNKFELHVYTLGNHAYAEKILRIIDPYNRTFEKRMISRDQNNLELTKSLNRVSLNHDNIVVIDDRIDVWNYIPNVLPVKPFAFYKSGDLNAPELLKKKAGIYKYEHKTGLKNIIFNNEIPNPSLIQHHPGQNLLIQNPFDHSGAKNKIYLQTTPKNNQNEVNDAVSVISTTNDHPKDSRPDKSASSSFSNAPALPSILTLNQKNDHLQYGRRSNDSEISESINSKIAGNEKSLKLFVDKNCSTSKKLNLLDFQNEKTVLFADSEGGLSGSSETVNFDNNKNTCETVKHSIADPNIGDFTSKKRRIDASSELTLSDVTKNAFTYDQRSKDDKQNTQINSLKCANNQFIKENICSEELEESILIDKIDNFEQGCLKNFNNKNTTDTVFDSSSKSWMFTALFNHDYDLELLRTYRFLKNTHKTYFGSKMPIKSCMFELRKHIFDNSSFFIHDSAQSHSILKLIEMCGGQSIDYNQLCICGKYSKTDKTDERESINSFVSIYSDFFELPSSKDQLNAEFSLSDSPKNNEDVLCNCILEPDYSKKISVKFHYLVVDSDSYPIRKYAVYLARLFSSKIVSSKWITDCFYANRRINLTK